MDPSTGTLHCRFMEPGIISSAVLEKVRCALLMSGTLHPPEMFAELLGIKDSAACRRYSSPFPLENRNILVMDNVTSRYENRDDEMYGRLARALVEASSAIPGNVAAFFPSYEMMGEIGKRLADLGLQKRILRERREMAKAEKDALLLDLRRDRNGLLLATVSGSFAGVVVVGLPLSPPSLESNELMQRIGKRVGDRKAMMYVRIYPAITKVLQSAGRAIRSETDRASIILLDDRYLGETVKKAFPDDFQMRRALDLRSELEAFHSRADGGKEKDGTEAPHGH
jgi:DNA excision repair protein ERCC-2